MDADGGVAQAAITPMSLPSFDDADDDDDESAAAATLPEVEFAAVRSPLPVLHRSHRSRVFSTFLKADCVWLKLSESGFKWRMATFPTAPDATATGAAASPSAMDPFYFTFPIRSLSLDTKAAYFTVHLRGSQGPPDVGLQQGYQWVQASLSFGDDQFGGVTRIPLHAVESVRGEGPDILDVKLRHRSDPVVIICCCLEHRDQVVSLMNELLSFDAPARGSVRHDLQRIPDWLWSQMIWMHEDSVEVNGKQMHLALTPGRLVGFANGAICLVVPLCRLVTIECDGDAMSTTFEVVNMDDVTGQCPPVRTLIRAPSIAARNRWLAGLDLDAQMRQLPSPLVDVVAKPNEPKSMAAPTIKQRLTQALMESDTSSSSRDTLSVPVPIRRRLQHMALLAESPTEKGDLDDDDDDGNGDSLASECYVTFTTSANEEDQLSGSSDSGSENGSGNHAKATQPADAGLGAFMTYHVKALKKSKGDQVCENFREPQQFFSFFYRELYPRFAACRSTVLGSSRWQVLSDRLFSLRGAATKSIDRAVAELEADMESGTHCFVLVEDTNAESHLVDFGFPGFDSQTINTGRYSLIRAWRLFGGSGNESYTEEQWDVALQAGNGVARELMQATLDLGASRSTTGLTPEMRSASFESNFTLLLSLWIAGYLAAHSQDVKEDQITMVTLDALLDWMGLSAPNRALFDSNRAMLPRAWQFNPSIYTMSSLDADEGVICTPIHFLRLLRFVLAQRIGRLNEIIAGSLAWKAKRSQNPVKRRRHVAIDELLAQVQEEKEAVENVVAHLPTLACLTSHMKMEPFRRHHHEQ
ncbi:hypothetical protein PBRA_000129 [Plasmodiophora brassicae]|uniref:Uncharacterized protein n=1 Tax=Plasmodiophora brassicae TaxID=37360 RepID=A0A0G4IGN6_PLABS|nr:hypothetical protein PBRA_000129 [Plasmodiophora brassicae]